jgi:hypothetical protein
MGYIEVDMGRLTAPSKSLTAAEVESSVASGFDFVLAACAFGIAVGLE